jgi:hypothetical protein
MPTDTTTTAMATTTATALAATTMPTTNDTTTIFATATAHDTATTATVHSVTRTSAVDDVDMDFFSRDSLQGASSVTGGVLRGRAQGNVYNMADKIKADDFVTKDVKGKVHIFRLHGNPENMEPYMTVKTKVTKTLGPVLKKLGAQYSPIRSKF